MESLAGVGAAALALMGYPSYVHGVLRGTTRPAVTSWCAWFLSAAIVTGAQIVARSGAGTLLAAAQVVGLGAVVIISTRRSAWHPRRPDVACIVIALVGAALGLIISSPGIAVAAAIAGNLVAGVPTYLSVLTNPDAESPWLWLCCGAAGGLAVVAAPAITLAHAGYGIYILIADLTIGCTALRGRPGHALAPSSRHASTSAEA